MPNPVLASQSDAFYSPLSHRKLVSLGTRSARDRSRRLDLIVAPRPSASGHCMKL